MCRIQSLPLDSEKKMVTEQIIQYLNFILFNRWYLKKWWQPNYSHNFFNLNVIPFKSPIRSPSLSWNECGLRIHLIEVPYSQQSSIAITLPTIVQKTIKKIGRNLPILPFQLFMKYTTHLLSNEPFLIVEFLIHTKLQTLLKTLFHYL